MKPPRKITKVSTGTTWEKMAGFCRAHRIGNRILVSGTTATDLDNNLVGKNDARIQTTFIISKIEHAIQQLGGDLKDVVRTRIYIRNLKDWKVIAQVHGEKFGSIKPVNSLVQAGIIGDKYLVEIEAEAIVGYSDAIL